MREPHLLGTPHRRRSWPCEIRFSNDAQCEFLRCFRIFPLRFQIGPFFRKGFKVNEEDCKAKNSTDLERLQLGVESHSGLQPPNKKKQSPKGLVHIGPYFGQSSSGWAALCCRLWDRPGFRDLNDPLSWERVWVRCQGLCAAGPCFWTNLTWHFWRLLNDPLSFAPDLGRFEIGSKSVQNRF